MSFSAEAWQRIGSLYDSILALPFNQEIAAGTLSRERFTFYMLQDALYLTQFGRALAATAARAPDEEAMIQFAGSAQAAVVVERELHAGFFKTFGITPEQAADTEPSPTCEHYTHYLLAIAHTAPYEAVRRGAAAVLLDLPGGRQPPARHRQAGQSLPSLDRHLRGRGVCGRGAQGDRNQRSCRRGDDARGARADAQGVRARLAAGMDVLGQRLAAGDLADLARGSFGVSGGG
jgi:hypothetical protein